MTARYLEIKGIDGTYKCKVVFVCFFLFESHIKIVEKNLCWEELQLIEQSIHMPFPGTVHILPSLTALWEEELDGNLTCKTFIGIEQGEGCCLVSVSISASISQPSSITAWDINSHVKLILDQRLIEAILLQKIRMVRSAEQLCPLRNLWMPAYHIIITSNVSSITRIFRGTNLLWEPERSMNKNEQNFNIS